MLWVMSCDSHFIYDKMSKFISDINIGLYFTFIFTDKGKGKG
jgi:hypothetical protein